MPIYQTIVDDIIKGIDKGDFKRGQKLPSIRRLSETYHCSKDTVQKAMMELKYLHKIYAVEKSGYYILEDKDFQEQEAELNPEDFALLPYQDFRTCLNESLVGRENYLFNYYHQQEGLEELIVSLQDLLVDYDVYAKKEQLVITSGSQQALYILTQLCHSQKNAKILIEHPTYERMQAILEEQSLTYETIERDFSGIDLEKLEHIFAKGQIDFFYTIPRLHNPLGTSFSLEHKKEIVRLAEKYKVYIIEDDYLADFDGQKQVPLHYFDTNERVIYIKSFTTTLFPALRIGGVVLPHDLIQDFLSVKSLIDYDTNLIMQKALSLYIDNGMFVRNTGQLRSQFLSKQKALQERISKLTLPFAVVAIDNQVIVQFPKQVKKNLPFITKIIEGKHGTFLTIPNSAQLEEQLQTLAKNS